MQLFASGTNAPLVRLDVLLDLKRQTDPRIAPFLVRVVEDGEEVREVRIAVIKQLRSARLVGNERVTAAHAIARVLAEAGDAGLRLQAATALACFADIEGVPSVLGGLALDPSESLDLRFSAFSSLERAEVSPESVRFVEKLTSDRTFGRAASALLGRWRIEPSAGRGGETDQGAPM